MQRRLHPITTLTNCGACGVACPPAPANATATCTNKTCGFSCTTGYANCGGGVCTNITDVDNCGACGTVCGSTHTTNVACAAGACQLTCEEDFANCNQNPSDGCETDTTTDNNNCGGCGTTCRGGPA